MSILRGYTRITGRILRHLLFFSVISVSLLLFSGTLLARSGSLSPVY
jgi:hypothetical protein